MTTGHASGPHAGASARLGARLRRGSAHTPVGGIRTAPAVFRNGGARSGGRGEQEKGRRAAVLVERGEVPGGTPGQTRPFGERVPGHLVYRRIEHLREPQVRLQAVFLAAEGLLRKPPLGDIVRDNDNMRDIPAPLLLPVGGVRHVIDFDPVARETERRLVVDAAPEQAFISTAGFKVERKISAPQTSLIVRPINSPRFFPCARQ